MRTSNENVQGLLGYGKKPYKIISMSTEACISYTPAEGSPLQLTPKATA